MNQRWHSRAVATAALLSLALTAGSCSSSTTTTAAPAGSNTATAPPGPPPRTCGSPILNGPSSAPPGAITVPAGDNSGVNWDRAGKTFWFAPGTHTLGTDQYDQIIPPNDASFIGAPGAVLDGQHINDYAFTQQARNVTIEYLTVQHFVAPQDEGVVNHDSGNGWTIKYNTIARNKGAALMAGAHQIVSNNCLVHNGQYGMAAYQAGNGITGLVFTNNEVAFNDADQYPDSCGCAGGVKFWAVDGATVTGNYVHDNHSVGLWADTNNVGFDIENNYVADNDAAGVMYEISYNAKIENNVFVRNALVEGPRNPGFPTGAVYISESGGDARLNGGVFSTFDIASNVFVDNWSGVVLWENANRFCGSPANSSSDDCTLVNPGVANLSTCAGGTIDDAPYYSDCRWKTQNVSVHDNVFSLDPARVPGCTAQAACGLNGVFSNWGTSPSWSPYKGPVIENAVTSGQNNAFSHNSYVGPWHLMYHDQGRLVAPT